MSRTIIENNMKGQILFRNAEGGAEFTIVVPLADEANP
jgi:signal transduction histidine kinase